MEEPDPRCKGSLLCSSPRRGMIKPTRFALQLMRPVITYLLKAFFNAHIPNTFIFKVKLGTLEISS